MRAYFAGLIVLFAVSALVGILYVRAESDENARSEALTEAAFAAKSASKEISGGVAILRGALGGLASDPSVSGIFAHPSQCALSFSQVGAFPTGHIDILRPTGAVVCSSRAGVHDGDAAYVGQPWVAAARSRPVVLAPVTDRATGQSVALFAVPVHGGIAAAFVNLRAVGPGLAAELAGPSGLRYVITSANRQTVLARSSDPTAWVGDSIVRTAFYRDGSSAQRRDLGGTTRLFATAVVPGLGWIVYAGLDRGVALASAGNLFDHELVIIIAALVLLLIATFLVQRRITSPIGQLSAAVRRGPEGGTAARVAGSHAPAEVVDLAEGFDTLAAAVKSELADRERAEEAAHAAEREAKATAEAYRMLFDNYPQPMWIYDEATLEIFEVNESAVEHYGYSREEFLGKSIKDLRPPEDVPALLESIAGARPRDSSGPWRHIKRDGSVIEVEVVSHVVDFRGRRGRLIVVTDVTERQRVQRQLDQMQRLDSLGQLAGGVAHDFNNLLGVILNYAAFVAEELAQPPASDEERWATVRDDVAQIQQAARRASDLTHQLLAFARREVINPEVMSLNDAVKDTRNLLRRSLGEHIELTTMLEDELWPVLTDPGQMEQILVNLAVNARDAMPDGGRLLIETANVDVDDSYASARPGLTPGRYVRLRVSDDGAGMDPKTLEHAFEPFYTTKPKGEGTGLGLATIYGIVTQAGGHARLYSEPGLGTTCTVMLPATEQGPRRRSISDTHDIFGRGEIVLVVEDEDGIREVARRILARRGYEVLTAASGPDAVELARNHEGAIDLLITDLIMPRMMGKEVAETIGAMRPATHIMYMSGYAHPILGSTQGLPADTILIEKPFTEKALLAKVREALGGSAPPRDG